MFIPRQDKPVYKHPLNDFDYEVVVDAIKDNWLNMGCQTNDEDNAHHYNDEDKFMHLRSSI